MWEEREINVFIDMNLIIKFSSFCLFRIMWCENVNKFDCFVLYFELEVVADIDSLVSRKQFCCWTLKASFHNKCF